MSDKNTKELVQESAESGYPIWDNSVRTVAIVGVIVLLILAFFLARDTLELVLISALAAYLLSPVVRFFTQKLKIGRKPAIALAYLVLILFVVLLIAVIVPFVSQKLTTFVQEDIPELITVANDFLTKLDTEVPDRKFELFGIQVDVSGPIEDAQTYIESLQLDSINVQDILPDIFGAVKHLFSLSTNFVSRIATGMILALTSVMATIHFSNDGYKLGGWFVNLFEKKYRTEVSELLHRLGRVWNAYFAGELQLMLWVGVISFLAFAALGIRWALLLGILAGFCEVIPNVGPILACVPAALSALIFGSGWLPLNNWVVMLLVVVASVLIQQAENIFLVPHIMGNALELHPAVLIIGMMVLSSRLGVWGAIFSAPIIALCREIMTFILRKIRRENPYPELSQKNCIPLETEAGKA